MASATVIGNGQAEIVSTDGKRIVLDCPGPAPPGAPLSFSLGGVPALYKLKVSSCKQSSERDAFYRIEGRLVDLTREQREALDRALHGGSS